MRHQKGLVFQQNGAPAAAEIKALWTSKDVPRKDKTAMVANGRYALQLDNPAISAMTETFSSVVGKERLVYFISTVSLFFPRFLVVSNV